MDALSQQTIDDRTRVKRDTLKALLYVMDARKNHDPVAVGAEVEAARRQRDLDADRLAKAIDAYRIIGAKDALARKQAMDAARVAAQKSADQLASIEKVHASVRTTELTAALERLRVLNGAELLDLMLESRSLVAGRI